MVESLAPLLHRHHLVLEASGSASTPWPTPPRLRQIVEHLVENAVKYAPPDTTVTRSTGRSSRASSRLSVSDEGPGIPEEWRERIFEPYARRDTHTARGSGIGLYAAKRLGRVDGRPPVVRTGRSPPAPASSLRPAGRRGHLKDGDAR